RHYRIVRENQSLNESRKKKLESKLESVYSVVMTNYSAAGHLKKIIENIKKINLEAGKLNRLSEGQLNETATKGHIVSCFKQLQDVFSLHTSIKGLYETVQSDESVDTKKVR